MKSPRLRLLFLPLFLTLAHSATAQGDPAVIEKLLYEGKENSQVWDTLTYLSEDIGNRLTGSTRLAEANAWTRDEFHRLGLKNAHLWKWGEVPVRFDRGPSHARMVAPSERELEFTAPSWSAGTDGPVRGKVVMMPKTLEELDDVVHDLDGAWVLSESRGRRGRRQRNETDEQQAAREEQQALDASISEALLANGIAGKIVGSSNELVLTSSIRGWRDLSMDTLPEDVEISVRRSDYDAMVQEIEAGNEVVVEIDLAHHFVEGPFGCFNTVAEIPGVEKPEEVVIFSGHLDSWDGPGSDGAQDNGTGCAVMLEAARILTTVGVQPKRTIRFILWTGEEQGLFGSVAYVASLPEEERARISAVFVDDGGTNYQGGAVCVEPMKEMLDAAFAPIADAFPDLPVENTVVERMPRGGGGSDHMPFNQAGIPAFFFKESGSGGREGKDYNFIHHTQHDTMRYAVPEYLVQSATCSAVLAYQLAQADTLLPREPAQTEAKPEPVDETFELTTGPLSGGWSVSMVGADAPDITFGLAIEMAKDGRLRGHMDGQSGRQRLRDGMWDEEKEVGTFAAMTDFGKLDFTARIEGDALTGSFAVEAMGMTMEFRGERDEPVTAAVSAAAPVSSDASSAASSTTSSIAGRWVGWIASMDSEFDLVLEVGADGVLTGRFESSQSDSALFDGKWNADARKGGFEYDYPHAGRLPVTFELVGDKLVGTIGENADFEATRVDYEPKKPDVAGRWVGLILSMDAEFDLILELGEGGALTGRFQSSQSDSELYKGKWNADEMSGSFEYDYPHAGRLPVTFELVGEKLVGTIGENADFEATRATYD